MDRSRIISTLLRSYPLYSGCGTLANHRITELLAGPMKPVAWASVAGGEVFADLSDHVGRAAYFSGDLDRKVTWICSRIVRPGDTVLDIGANIGIVSVWLSELAGSNGSVHAFEPNPDIATVLQAGLEQSGAQNTTVHQVALGTEEGSMELVVPRRNRGSASLIRHRDRGDCDVYSVPVTTLSEIVRSKRIGPIRFIKMDVEGFEENVLRGGVDVLRMAPPAAILFESAEPGSGDAVVDLFRGFGYEIYVVPRCLTSMHLHRLTEEEQQASTYADLLAIHTGAAYAEIRAAVHAID